MSVQTACIFCEIAAGRAPHSLVFQDDLAVAFLDIQPVNPGHTLVIPREHYASLADLEETAGRHMFHIAQRVARAIRISGVRCEGVNLFLADGEAAFQDVFHVHLHVLPRFRGDSFTIHTGGPGRPARAVLDETAASIREAYHRFWEKGS